MRMRIVRKPTREPFPHQERALESLCNRDAVALFWEMRLGKTLTAIRWAASKESARRILIVTPKTVMPVWADELSRERQSYTVLTGRLDGRAEKVCSVPGVRFFISNYEGLIKPGAPRHDAAMDLARLRWDGVILDESTRIKNPSAKVSRVAVRWLGRARYKMILSGLPNPEGPLDFFQQMVFLQGTFLGCSDFYKFRRRFFQPIGYEWVPKTRALEAIKKEVKRGAHELRRKHVGTFTRKIYETRWLDLPSKMRTRYRAVERDYEYETQETKYTPVKRAWCLRLASGFAPVDETLLSTFKFEELLSLLKGELAKERVLVFFRHNAELCEAQRLLSETSVSITGASSSRERQLAVREFRDGAARVLFCQSRCVQYGLNLSFASTVIYFSNWDDLETRRQTEDRVVARGNSNALIVDLVTRNTVDADIHTALGEKHATAAAFRWALVKHLRKRRKFNASE